jgi:hypothetical protein
VSPGLHLIEALGEDGTIVLDSVSARDQFLLTDQEYTYVLAKPKRLDVIVKDRVERDGEFVTPGIHRVEAVGDDGTMVVSSKNGRRSHVLQPNEFILTEDCPLAFTTLGRRK